MFSSSSGFWVDKFVIAEGITWVSNPGQPHVPKWIREIMVSKAFSPDANWTLGIHVILDVATVDWLRGLIWLADTDRAVLNSWYFAVIRGMSQLQSLVSIDIEICRGYHALWVNPRACKFGAIPFWLEITLMFFPARAPPNMVSATF